MTWTTWMALAAVVFAPLPALAQGLNEVVVTASRYEEEYEDATPPPIGLPKRADFLLTEVTVTCDTRDAKLRDQELRQTLRSLIRSAAQDSTIELSVGEEIITPFDETMIEKAIQPSRSKTDTSQAAILVKTRISAPDTYDAAVERIEDFVDRTQTTGRTEILVDGDFGLSVVGPQGYRLQIAGLIAQDAHKMAAAFGEGYGVRVEDLEKPVAWYQSGPLDLMLYIPYALTVERSPR